MSLYAETILQMMLRGNSWVNLHASQGRLSGSSLLRSDGSEDNQTGRLSHMGGGQKQLKGGAIRLERLD
jgi:hypothetical protein